MMDPAPRSSLYPSAAIVRYFLITLCLGVIGAGCITSTIRYDRPSRLSKSPGVKEQKPADPDDFGSLLPDENDGRSIDLSDTGRLRKILSGWLGTPYRWGGMARSGVDCSGLVGLVFREYADMAMPRSSRDMLPMGRHVPVREARLGDLFLFRNKLKFADHVGICTGNGRFIHASVSHGVIESTLDDEYYRSRFIDARRIFK
jgi:probable lipoprotein NlpC